MGTLVLAVNETSPASHVWQWDEEKGGVVTSCVLHNTEQHPGLIGKPRHEQHQRPLLPHSPGEPRAKGEPTGGHRWRETDAMETSGQTCPSSSYEIQGP